MKYTGRMLDYMKRMAQNSGNKTRGIPRTEEIRRRIGLAQLGKKRSDITRQRNRESRMRQRFPTKETSIERKLQDELRKRNIEFKTHMPIICSVPDIFIEPNICIFADGNYWHNKPDYKKRDARINNTLRENGYKVLRYWESEINANAEECVDEVEEALTNWG